MLVAPRMNSREGRKVGFESFGVPWSDSLAGAKQPVMRNPDVVDVDHMTCRANRPYGCFVCCMCLSRCEIPAPSSDNASGAQFLLDTALTGKRFLGVFLVESINVWFSRLNHVWSLAPFPFSFCRGMETIALLLIFPKTALDRDSVSLADAIKGAHPWKGRDWCRRLSSHPRPWPSF